MTDTINQMRLSMRLDAYLRAYIGKNVKGDNLSRDEWDTVWQVADSARTNKNLIIARIDHLISARWMRPLSQRW
jgi:BMFP domain-containing protein YqiC